MSNYFFGDMEETSGDLFSEAVEPTGFGDVFSATKRYTRAQRLADSKDMLMGERYDAREQEIYSLLSDNPTLKDASIFEAKEFNRKKLAETYPDLKQLQESRSEMGESDAVLRSQGMPGDMAAETLDLAVESELDREQLNTFYDRLILERRKADDRWNNVKTSTEVLEDAKKEAKDAEIALQEANAGNPNALSRIGGAIAGGVAATATDRTNLAVTAATMAITPALFPRAGWLARAGIEAVANAGVEVIAAPDVAQWQKELGNQYGMPELAEDAFVAAVFGAGFSVAGDVAIPALYKAGKYGAKKSQALFNMARRADDMGRPDVRVELDVMAKQAAVKEVDPGSLKMTDQNTGMIALKAIDDAAENGRRIKQGDLPDEAQLTNRAQAEKIEDPTMRAEYLDALDKWKKDVGVRRVGEPRVNIEDANVLAETGLPSGSKEQLSIIGNAVERARESLKETMINIDAQRLTEIMDANPKMKMFDDAGNEITTAQFKESIDRIDRVKSAISECGVG